MIITIDIGNSYIKAAVFSHNNIVDVFTETDLRKVWELLEAYPKAQTIWCSVGMKGEELSNHIASRVEHKDYVIFGARTPIPIKNLYENPATLGLDRLAAAIGATTIFPNTNVLIIDAGTCITYDVVTAQQEYLGGSISPGFQLRYKSLHDYTARLPLLDRVANIALTGNNTEDAIRSGVVNGVIGEMKQIILQYQSLYPNLPTIICGGDSEFLVENLPTENISIEKNLVHLGLHAVMTNLKTSL